MPCPPRFPVPYFSAGLARAVSAPRRDLFGGLLPDALRHESLSGSGTLRGWSGYRPTGNTQDAADPAAPWNAGPVRKWLAKSLAGYLRTEFYTETGLGGDLICLLPASFPIPAAASFGDEWSGTAIIDPATGAYLSQGTVRARDYGASPATGACNITAGAPGSVTGLDGGGYDAAEAYTLTKRTRTGAGYAEPANPAAVQWRSKRESGIATETLSSPDTEFAALARSGGAVAGTETEARPGVYALTSPTSIDPLNFVDAVAVRVFPSYRGLEVGAPYTARAWVSLRSLTGGANSTYAATADFSPAASDCEVPFDLPAVAGFASSLVHFDLIEA